MMRLHNIIFSILLNIQLSTCAVISWHGNDQFLLPRKLNDETSTMSTGELPTSDVDTFVSSFVNSTDLEKAKLKTENWRTDVETVDSVNTGGAGIPGMNNAVNFMKKFGYVPEGDSMSAYVYSPENLSDKLKLVQKFGAIPETGLLDNATLDLMTSPRCGVKDLTDYGSRRKKRYVVGGSGWKKRKITYHVANWSPKLWSKENVQVELKRAFAAWTEYSRLSFMEVNNTDADIIIFFATYSHYDGYPFDGAGGILAHAFYPYEFDTYGGDIHFDESEAWKYKDEKGEGLDFFTVAVHEIGHSLGLAHSYIYNSIMFPYYKGYTETFALDYDDVMGMWELYIKRRLEGDDEYFNTTSTSTSTTSTTSSPTFGQNDDPNVNSTDEDVKYDGDYETVDEHKNREKNDSTSGTELPALPPLFPTERTTDDTYKDIYEEDRKKKEEERRKYEEDRQRKWEEDNERRRREEARRREEERIRREDEEIRRKWEDEEHKRKLEEEEKRRKWREEENRRVVDEEERRRTEEEAKRQATTVTSVTAEEDTPPDICEGGIDSVATIRDELFIFKGKHVWRYHSKGSLVGGYPSLTHFMFNGLPHWMQRVDAVYERKNDSYIVFFIGKYFFLHDGVQLHPDSPQSLKDYDLPEVITKVDAVFVWPKNMKTYLFRRNLYWRRDDFSNTLDASYPRDIERWNGLPSDLDAAHTDSYGHSYFFKGKTVWAYDNSAIKPRSTTYNIREWTGC